MGLGLSVQVSYGIGLKDTVVSFVMQFGVGGANERLGTTGIAHLLEHMLFKGTEKLSALEVNEAFDRTGAQFNAFTSEENTVYYAAVLPEYLQEVSSLWSQLMRPSLRDDDFNKAADEFRLAVKALDILDRDDAKAREVRQMLRESHAINELSPMSLYDMLARFDKSALAGNSWQNDFTSDYANRWIVLVTTVRQDPRGTGHVILDFPLSVGGTPVRLTGNPTVFGKLSLSDKPKRVKDGARDEVIVAACKPAGNQAAQGNIMTK